MINTHPASTAIQFGSNLDSRGSTMPIARKFGRNLGISVFRLRVSPILSLSLSFYCDTLNGSIIMVSIPS